MLLTLNSCYFPIRHQITGTYTSFYSLYFHYKPFALEGRAGGSSEHSNEVTFFLPCLLSKLSVNSQVLSVSSTLLLHLKSLLSFCQLFTGMESLSLNFVFIRNLNHRTSKQKMSFKGFPYWRIFHFLRSPAMEIEKSAVSAGNGKGTPKYYVL